MFAEKDRIQLRQKKSDPAIISSQGGDQKEAMLFREKIVSDLGRSRWRSIEAMPQDNFHRLSGPFDNLQNGIAEECPPAESQERGVKPGSSRCLYTSQRLPPPNRVSAIHRSEEPWPLPL